ncbi:protein kinase domain-containing protein [Aporhodopirellula aestuarii]
MVEDEESDPNATIEENGDDPNATVEETRDFAPDATLAEHPGVDSHATVVEDEDFDPDATVEEDRDSDPNVTIAESGTFDSDATVEETRDFDPDATIEEHGIVDLDSTMDEPPTEVQDVTVPNLSETVVETNGPKQRPAAYDPSSPLDVTAESLATVSENPNLLETVEGDRDEDSLSVLDDTNLGQTINPRALSDAEAKYWNEISAEFTSNREPTALPPAIDRTIVETRLQLRNQTVATQIHPETDGTDYRLVRLLGRGGMGNVFVARQGSLDRLIAVKVIRPLDTAKRERLAKEGKLETVEQNRRQQFLSEAVVTGDLDHPNIVPIHDVAVTGDNTLFYSMKRVVGTPWSDVINEKTRDENLEILIKVADAIGFAHTRGVIHRDIKPENVMLGDFGVVMVMDWGIALATPEFEKLDSITPATRLGGTPSMMSPEMAIGPVDRIGPAADIYLLGATLFMVITGQPPHHAANVSQCLRAVANNEIRDFDPKHNGELMDIALKAMAADPSDRYADTKQFQDAIRQYRSHAESISLAARATDDLREAKERKSYPLFTRAQFGFEEALALWDGNEKARTGLKRTRIDHAEAAYLNQDYDLGLSLLDKDTSEHAELIGRLKEALRLRRQRETRFAILKKAAAAMLAFILIGGSVALYIINEARTLEKRSASIAQYQSKIAKEQTEIAKDQTKIAEEQKRLAEEQKLLAEARTREVIRERERADQNAREAIENAALAEAKKLEAIHNLELAAKERDRADQNAIEALENAEQAIQNARSAEIARAKAEYEAYVSGVGLAKARIDRNEFTEAHRLIADLIGDRPPKSVPWELRYLSSLANQASASIESASIVTDFAIAQDAPDHPAILRLDDGTLAALNLTTPRTVPKTEPSLTLTSIELPTFSQSTRTSDASGKFSSIAIRRDGSLAAAGSLRGDIVLWDPRNSSSQPGQTSAPALRLQGHRDRITDLQMVGDTYLVSSSTDRTIRIWETATGTELETLWHIAPVIDMSVGMTAEGIRIAAAIAEKGLGQVVVWDARSADQVDAKQVGIFDEHDKPLTCVAMSPDSNSVASGDTDGNVLLWSIDGLENDDVAKLVRRAVQSSSQSNLRSSKKVPSEDSATSRTAFTRLLSNEEASSKKGPVSPASSAEETAHELSVRNVHFCDDGQTLITCGDDYLIRVWRIAAKRNPADLPQWELTRTLRGHGGPVFDAAALTADGEQIISAGADQSIRMWLTGDSVAVGVNRNTRVNQPASIASVEPTSTQVHEDEIWSASMSADGRHVVTASRDRTAKVMSINPRTLLLGNPKDLITEESDSSGDTPSNHSGMAAVSDLTEGTAFRAMSMALDVASQRLFVGGADSVVRVWNLRRGTELETIPDTGLNQILAVSRDTRVILTGSSSPESRTILWRFDPAAATAEIMHRLGGHEESVAAVALSPDASHALTADRAGRALLWDVSTGTQIGSPIDLLLGTRINAAAFSPDGQSIWLAADDQRLSRIDLRSREIVDRLEHDGFVTSIQFSIDGRRVITTSELQKIDSTIHRAVWWQLADTPDSPSKQKNLVTMTVKSRDRTRSGGRPGIASVALDATGQLAIVAINPVGDAPSQVQQWLAKDDVRRAEKKTVLGLPSRIGDLSSAAPVSEDELVTMHGNSAFRWNTRSRELEMSYRINGALSVAVFSPQGDLVATGSRSVKLWDTRTGDAVGKLESPHEGATRCIAFANDPNVTEFYTGGDDGAIRFWSYDRGTAEAKMLATIAPSHEPNAHVLHRPLSLSISPNGRSLLSTTDRGRVVLHDLVDQSQRILFDDESAGAIHACCFSPDGRFVAAGGQDRLARMWDLSKNHSSNDPPDAVFQGHAEAIQDVALAGNILPSDAAGSTLRLFTASQDRSVRVWDPRFSVELSVEDGTAMPEQIGPKGRELLELLRHTDGVMAVDVNAEDTLMMTAGREGKVILWPAP